MNDVSERTVADYIDRQTTDPLRVVAAKGGMREDLSTCLGDLLVATMHALDLVARNLDEPDPRVATVAVVELAVKHYLTESYALRIEPDITEDVLGGYPMPYVHIEADFGA